MSKARERQKKRRERQKMTKRVSSPNIRQISPPDALQLPKITLPGGRWLLLILAAIIVFIGVILALGLINPLEVENAPNAIWLDERWTHGERSESEFATFAGTLQDNQIGSIFAYVSSLKADGSWSGILDRRNQFSEVETAVQDFVAQIRAAYPDVELYAWIEVAAATPEGYRLDNPAVHGTVASFSSRMVNRFDFDGVLIDAKPIFDPNEDYISFLRAIRSQIGLDVPMLVAVPPDLTPANTDLNLTNRIAPGTEWPDEYKQRVALQADQLVIGAFNSYQTNPIDYIEWVTYQVDAYTEALNERETGATVLISVPNYAESLPAHDASVENLSAALDGVRRGLLFENEDEALELDLSFVEGVAIFTDTDLSANEWRIYRDKWLDN